METPVGSSYWIVWLAAVRARIPTACSISNRQYTVGSNGRSERAGGLTLHTESESDNSESDSATGLPAMVGVMSIFLDSLHRLMSCMAGGTPPCTGARNETFSTQSSLICIGSRKSGAAGLA